jgi:transcriptional regulator with XRE-family HTH domain
MVGVGARDLAQRFGQNLYCCRKQADLSQEELSYRASVHRTEISQLERGLRLPRLDTIIKLGASLELLPDDLDELLKGMDWRPGDVRRGNFKFREEA